MMQWLALVAVIVGMMGGFVLFRVPFLPWLWVFAGTLILGTAVGLLPATGAWVLAALQMSAAFLLSVPPLRRRLVSAPLLARVRKILPPVSRTEREAIEAGTVWWDGELFRGDPDWRRLHAVPPPLLTDAEQAFLDGPVSELCEMLDDWEITHCRNDLPPAVWRFLRERRFFGLNIPEQWGGLGFSPLAQSAVVQKISSRSGSAAVTVMVPNSLGPAELLLHYGTEAQRAHYLPRLASGEEIPCFALTGPWSGSDAGAMPDVGVACHGEHQGRRTLGFRVNWEKRYITLGPVATLLGLAFRVCDPEHLLGDEEEPGITCALVPADTPGVEIGSRHLPLNAAFQNGPNRGRDVFVPMEWVIGGRAQVGNGWRMLMESLAAGRGLSLPALAAGTAKLAARTSGAYARVREQFGISIGRFEGVEEALARIGGRTWLLDSARLLMAGGLGIGEKPAVVSAIVKQQCTELARCVLNDAMDLHGGKAVCMGPRNYLARHYQQIPIAITVEGSNILTRSMIIFGQGAMRCHPWLAAEARAAAAGDLARFDRALAGHAAHLGGNAVRAFVLGVTRGRAARRFGRGAECRYYAEAARLSAAFAWLADIALLRLGGGLKRREMLSGRFADVLGNLYLCSAALKRFRDDGAPGEDRPLLDWSCRWTLFQAQEALHGILRNFPGRWLGAVLRLVVFPGGRYLEQPDDALVHEVARLLQQPGAARERLTAGIHPGGRAEDVVPTLERALLRMVESEGLRRRLRRAGKRPRREEEIQALVEEGLLSNDEAALLEETLVLVRKVIRVDDFPPEQVAAVPKAAA